jgi:UDP-N-acetylmuramyl pentapeptide synthase
VPSSGKNADGYDFVTRGLASSAVAADDGQAVRAESEPHIEAGCLAAFASVRYLIGNANAGRLVSAAAGGVEAEHVSKAAAAPHLVRRRWAPGDVVLLKGSHDAGLQAVARQLVEGGAPERASATRSEVACRSTAPSTCEGSA